MTHAISALCWLALSLSAFSAESESVLQVFADELRRSASQESPPIALTARLTSRDGEYFLSFRLTNISAQPLKLSPSRLPWSDPSSLCFAAIATDGTQLRNSRLILHSRSIARLTIDPGDSCEGEYPLAWGFSPKEMPAGTDVLLMWVYQVVTDSKGPFPICSGVVLLPKRPWAESNRLTHQSSEHASASRPLLQTTSAFPPTGSGRAAPACRSPFVSLVPKVSEALWERGLVAGKLRFPSRRAWRNGVSPAGVTFPKRFAPFGKEMKPCAPVNAIRRHRHCFSLPSPATAGPAPRVAGLLFVRRLRASPGKATLRVVIRTVEAVIDERGTIRLLEPVQVARNHRALVTILDEDPAPSVHETALLSERALAEDWNRPEEDAAWSYLQQAR
jgi:hypothetical protein